MSVRPTIELSISSIYLGLPPIWLPCDSEDKMGAIRVQEFAAAGRYGDITKPVGSEARKFRVSGKLNDALAARILAKFPLGMISIVPMGKFLKIRSSLTVLQLIELMSVSGFRIPLILEGLPYYVLIKNYKFSRKGGEGGKRSFQFDMIESSSEKTQSLRAKFYSQRGTIVKHMAMNVAYMSYINSLFKR